MMTPTLTSRHDQRAVRGALRVSQCFLCTYYYFQSELTYQCQRGDAPFACDFHRDESRDGESNVHEAEHQDGVDADSHLELKL